MHRVLNAGSVLQTYALFMKIKELGYECEIIDYLYPNEFHKKKSRSGNSDLFWKSLFPRIKYFILYRSRKQKRRFNLFLDKNLNLSISYPTSEALIQSPPVYDIYVTGSDQVWNPICMKGDASFFCMFSNNKAKLSYASSFSKHTIPDAYVELYKEYLRTYKALSVREESGQELIYNLTGQSSTVVCDPTLLLEKDNYIQLAECSKINIREPYLLAYILDYAYDPYPTIQELINIISKKKKLKVIYLLSNSVDHYHWGNSVTSAGPNEFINLFLHASFVVTSSFHGTVFSLIFEKQFYSVVPKEQQEDSRVYSFLNKVGLQTRAILVGSKIPDIANLIDYVTVKPLIDKFRKDSFSFLEKALK